MSRALALVDSSDESRKHHDAGTTSRAPLLDTKLYVPRARSGVVSRPRLLDSVDRGTTQKLTVVVAPAGFGKTTLLAAWLDERSSAATAGWVSLDPSENEPKLFWGYFIRALQTARPGTGADALSLLDESQPDALEHVLTTLINEIDGADANFTVVLDDYHVIDTATIHEGVTFLLDRMPRRLHLVIASRAEPPVALPRLRARGELTELRASDLRFTADEAATFLNQVMSLGLTPADAGRLGQRTEGWIAGLKLAALSMKGRDDAAAFVDSFSGDNRYVTDYLVDEVLRTEPEPVRRFLLGTAILDRLSGPLCDAVTGRDDAQSMLEDLERRNLFVVALDDRREWYRYHHLFADVLQKQSARADPAGIRHGHSRASAWYETHGFRADAVRHAIAALDSDRAARLLEGAWPGNDRSYESRRWLDRVKALPVDVVRARPVLSMGYAWALLNSGELEAAEPWLRIVERWLAASGGKGGDQEEAPATRMIVSDEARVRTLGVDLASARVYLAQSRGEVPGTLEHARHALDLAPAGDHMARATGTALVALAHWGQGSLETAHQVFSDALDHMRTAGHDLDAIRGIFVLGDIRVAQGRLREAAGIYQDGLRIAATAERSTPAETDELSLGLSELHREWNHLSAAVGFLDSLTQSAERAAHRTNRLRWCTAMAAVRTAQGELDAALALLDEAERQERRDPLPRVRPIPAMKARIRIAQGRLDAASDWAKQAKVSADDDLSYLREFEHITLARLLVATALREAVRVLDRLRASAQNGGRMGSVIEIQVQQSIAQQTLGNQRGALEFLGEAVALAEAEGFLRVFLDEGVRLRDLLRTAVARGVAGEYARRVLAAFEAPRQPVAQARARGATPVQPLTTRELEILRLIAAGLRNQEIADHLSISAATVKRHIANTYGKLGASHRTEALKRAADQGLI